MRQWHHEVALTAQALTSVLTHPLGEVDLDVALTARAAALDHVANVIGDLAPRTRASGARTRRLTATLDQIEADPIGSLGHVLRRRELPHLTRSPSELLDVSRPVDAATEAWREVGRRALLADRAWPGATACALEPEVAWHALAEAAVLAQAVAVLDGDLAVVGAHRPDVQALIASTAGLRVVVGEVLGLAAPHRQNRPAPSASAEPERTPEPTPAAAVTARSTGRSTVVRDTGRLRALLDQAPELTPQQARACARVARNLSVLAAATATSTTGTDLCNQLGDLARDLHAAAQRGRGEVALRPAPARALELQIRELHISTQQAFATKSSLNPDDANRLARRLPDLVETLAGKAHDQIDHGRWALPDHSDRPPLPYALASCWDPERTPPMLTALRQAGTAAEALRDHVAQTGAGCAANPALAAAVGSLRGIVQERGVTRQRAAHPALAIPRQAEAKPLA